VTPAPNPADDLLLPSEAARILGVSRGTIRNYADYGDIPVTRTVSGRRLFRRSDVEQLAGKRKRKAQT